MPVAPITDISQALLTSRREDRLVSCGSTSLTRRFLSMKCIATLTRCAR